MSITDPFDLLILPILAEEGMGTLTTDPDDNGGTTIWGITEDTARSVGYIGDMSAMTQVQATAIYRMVFWSKPAFDQIYAIQSKLATYMLDIGINTGPDVPGTFLQRCLNVLNNGGTLYPDLEVDGKCGALTRAALTAYRAVRVNDNGDDVLLGMMRGLAVNFYIELAEAQPVDEKYEYGWVRNRALSLDF